MVAYFESFIEKEFLFRYSITDFSDKDLNALHNCRNVIFNKDNSMPILLTEKYAGKSRPVLINSNIAMLDLSELETVDTELTVNGFDVWGIIDNAINTDPDFSVNNLSDIADPANDIYYYKLFYWSINRGRENADFFCTYFHELSPEWKEKLLTILVDYDVEVNEHVQYNSEELNDYRECLQEMREEAIRDEWMDREMDDAARDEMNSWGDDWWWGVIEPE